MRAIDRVTEALHRAGSRQIGSDWTCPHHKNGTEKSPSLSVTEGAKGVIMNCHAGCKVEEVVASIGLKMSDLFDEPLQKEKTVVTDTYVYRDENGDVLFEVLRKVSESSGKKTFSQRRRVDGKWVYKLADVRRVLYHLPELRAAVAGGASEVWIPEGEKDVHALEARGVVATCNPGGAGKWRDEYVAFLEGVERVVVVRDKDGVGSEHANAVVASITKHLPGTTVAVVEAKEGKDAYDHFSRGFGIDDFLPLSESDVKETPETEHVDGDASSDSTSTNPMFAKLLEAHEILDIPPPTYLIQDFLVAGSLCVLYGKPGSAKSFAAIDMSLCVAMNMPWFGNEVKGGEVLYFIAEGLSGFGKRMRAWQIDRGVKEVSGLRWYPEAINLLDPTQVDQAVELVDTLQPILVVIDTLARSLPGGDENASATMSAAIEAMDRMRKVSGACVMFVHHTPKDGSNPRGHGSLEGAVQTMIRATNDDGFISLTVEKQKDGEEVDLDLRLRKIFEADSCVLGTAFGFSAETLAEQEIENAALTYCGPEGMPANLFLEVAGISKATFYRLKEPMLAKGSLVNVGTAKQPRFTHKRHLH